MTHSTFEKTILYFASQLEIELEEEVDPEGVEIELDPFRVVMKPTQALGGLYFELFLGFLHKPLTPEHLNILADSNYMGSGTNGCAFALDEEKTRLFLTLSTTQETTYEAYFQLFTTIIHVANAWQLILEEWPEFKPAFIT